MEKSTIKRKLGVCLMALAMVVAMIPSWSVTANAATDYGLAVGGEAVTSDHTSGNGWSYNQTTKTLTLDGYSYSGKGWVQGDYSGGIYSSANLTIELKGSNEVVNTGSGSNMWWCGIYSAGNLTIKGAGSLTVKGGTSGLASSGIYAKSLTVENGMINAIGQTANGNSGIYTAENVVINGGIVNASADTSLYGGSGIECGGSFTMNGGRVTATAAAANTGRDSYGIKASSSIAHNGGVLSAEGQTKAMKGTSYPEGYNNTDKTFQSYEDATSSMYTVSKANNNDWYNSDVTVTAKTGYTISKTANGTFGSSISFTDETENGNGVFYIKSGNTIYKGSISYKLDKTAPKFNDVTNDGTYCKSKEFTVTEDYLFEVKDGSNKLGAWHDIYKLSVGTHTITATDLAGNSTRITVTVNKDHTPNEDDGDCTTAVTCSVCHSVVTAAKEHNFSGTWKSDQTGHWHECQNAKCTKMSAKEAHVSSGEATETKAETCTVCGYTIKAALDHEHARNLQPVDAVAATCTTEGHKAYYKCSCDKLFSDSNAQHETFVSEITIPATGHSYGTPVYTWSGDNMTCTAVRTCEKCNAQEKETGTAVTKVTPKDGCKTPEITLYTVTFNNGVFGVQTKEVVTKKADAHTPSEWIVDKEATTAEAGSRHKECTECGTILKTETIAKLTVSNGNTNPSGKNDADQNTGEKSASNVPGTGDTSLVDLWALLMAAAVLGGVFALDRQRKVR